MYRGRDFCTVIVYTTLILLIGHLRGVQGQSQFYICGGDAIPFRPSTQDEVIQQCFKLGDYPRSWRDAQAYCRRQGGTLVTELNQRNPRLFSDNSIDNLWSGMFVRDGRLIKDTAASPEPFDNTLSILFNRTEPFYAEEGDCVEFGKCTSQEIEPEPQSFCLSPYLYHFRSCDDELNFVCEIPAKSLFILEKQNDYFTIDGHLDFNMQFTASESSKANSDQTCSKEVPGGKTFTLSNEADSAILTVLAEGVPEHLRSLGLTEGELPTILFWIHNKNEQECYAMSFQPQGLALSSSYIVSWPCDAQLRVLCQFDKTYPDQTPPQMKATINSNLIRNKGSDVLAHSDVIRLIGGAQPTSPVNVGPDEPPIDDQSLQIKCSLPFLNTLQSATIYKSGVAVNVYEGQRFSRVDQLEYSVDLSIDEIPDFPGSYNIIESAVSYSCDYNDATSGRLLSSNSLFVRPTDFEILSVHFYLVRNQPVIDWPTAILWSLLNFWPVENEGGDLGPQRRQVNGNTEQVLREIGLAFADSGYQLTPMQLRDQGPDSDGVLIMRAYMKMDSSDSSVFTDVPQNDQALKYLQEYAKDSLTDLGEIGVTKIEVFSIDWCWATKRTVTEVDQEYDIPITRAPGVWKSPQICARDNAPLVTIECRGNKREGFSWGPTQINSLCNYGSQEGGTESSITDDLQDLSQADVTPDNVNTTVTNLKTLVGSVDPDDITPTDVNYIADVLQKATTTGGDLEPQVVSDILQTVNDMSQLPVDVLGDGQRLGNSSNRILRAADKAGSLLEIPAGSTQERLVSGGVGLEVWDIAQKSPDSSVIVGIKMLSDGSQEVVAFEELVSQFSDSQVEYVGTQAAIYLPEEFIRTYTNNNSNTEVRLSMNVYKVTNLYRDPSFGQDDGVNRTLNSRVIAAQLLVGGEEITDLGGYKVLTVFEPTVYVFPTEERPNRTTCVYWDFSANEGAGGWGSDGCTYGRTTEGRDLCECDHLTNFAVLVSFYDQSELEHKEILGYITIVGLSLSIAGLAMSMLSFIFIRKLRKGRPQQTLFQLSLALLLSWIVFLAGIERTSDHDGCIAVAAILHYLILASFMWMLMEALLQYLLFVRVMNSYFTHYMWKTSIPSWGLPVIPVVIILAIDTELYKGGEDYCWMDLDAFYYGFAIPVGLIVLTNLVVFILVTISLWRRKDMSKHSTQKSDQTLVNIRASFICFCVLGLSWIFGFLAIEDARLVFQYLFCITASLQGFIVFLMMTARDKQVRQYWKQHLCCCCPSLGKKKGESSTSASSNSKAGSQEPMHIPRVHSTKTKQEVSSLTHNTMFSSESDANGDDYGLMGQQPNLGQARRGSAGYKYGQGESVLF